MADPVPTAAPVPGDVDYVDHTAIALGRLPEQFKALTNIQLVISALCTAGVQPIESCLRQLLTQRSLDTAVGAQLDSIGLVVGQSRDGHDDETYRRFLRATISAHRSKGTIEDLIRVIDLVIFDDAAHYAIVPQTIATVVIRVEDIAIAADLANVAFVFMARTAATGMRVMLEYGISAPEFWFRFNSGPGFNQGHLIGRIDH